MITRRSALTMVGALPVGVSIWTADTFAGDRPIRGSLPLSIDAALTPDRELSLTLADGFHRQQWSYAGQRYVEHRDEIILFEGEKVRLHIVNDTAKAQSLSLDDTSLELTPNQTVAFDLHVDELRSKVLRIAHSTAARTLAVRPSYQSHAPILNV